MTKLAAGWNGNLGYVYVITGEDGEAVGDGRVRWPLSLAEARALLGELTGAVALAEGAQRLSP